MEELEDYIRLAPYCMGLDGKGCEDYIARASSDSRSKFSNRYRAILIDYKTGLPYYDKYCESCRFKNEANVVVATINRGGKYYFNPKEYVDNKSHPMRRRGVVNFNIDLEKEYCHKSTGIKRRRYDEDDAYSEKRRKLDEERYKIELNIQEMERFLEKVKNGNI